VELRNFLLELKEHWVTSIVTIGTVNDVDLDSSFCVGYDLIMKQRGSPQYV
jgi:hypothetical protein